jgi:DNA-binding winged helix-turn-helix (wHTH) protein/Tfp pilus assembly protein PilF
MLPTVAACRHAVSQRRVIVDQNAANNVTNDGQGQLREPQKTPAMPATARFGRLRFDADSLVLYDGSEIVPLAPLPARMLAELLRADAGVVSPAQMRKVLWDDAPIEDRNLNQQIYVLRRALRRDPRVTIQNVPRRGYRLVVAPPAPVPARRRGIAFAGACVALAILVLLPRAQQSQSAAALFNRDLAAGNYLLTSEGPGHLDRAATYYHDLVALDPNNAAGYGGLAIIDARRALDASGSLRAHSFGIARIESEAALARNAKESNALTALGIIASVHDHRTDAAKRLFDAAVAADPTAESPRAWRGKFRLSISRFSDAGQDFRTISQNAPTSGSAVGLFGEWLVLKRDYVRASAVLSQAVGLGNHPGFTRYWLARSYSQRGLDTEALRLSNILLALYPNEPAALTLRLRIEARHGKMQAALADLHTIEQTRDRQVDPIALASADVAMGKQADAISTLQHYISSETRSLDEIDRILTDPDFDALRNNPKFNTALHAITS